MFLEIVVYVFGVIWNWIFWWVVGKLWFLLGVELVGLGCLLKIYFYFIGILCYMNDNIVYILKLFGF